MRRLAQLLLSGAALAMALGSATVASAETYPTRPIRIQVGAGPGSGSDLTARLIGAQLAERAGQSVVIENRAGAAGLIATHGMAQNGGDPYQVLWVSGTIVSSHLTQANAKVDIFRDLKPLIQVGDSQLLLLVNKRLPAENYRQLIELMHRQPGKLNFGSTGMGGATHLYMEELFATESVQLTHIPYKGTGEALNALLAGEIDVMLATQSIAGSPIRAGQIKAMAITGPHRTPGLPDVPTFKEAGNARFNATILSGFMVNAKVDPEIIGRLNGWLNAVLAEPEMHKRLREYDMAVRGGTPEQLQRSLLEELHKQQGLLSRLNLK